MQNKENLNKLERIKQIEKEIEEKQEELKRREITKNRRIKAGLLRVVMLAMLLMVSTYAWFTSQKDITLANLRGTIEVVENMEISLDGKLWHQKIDLIDAGEVFKDAQKNRDDGLEQTAENRTTLPAILPNQLLPVSGIGEIGSTVMPLYTGTASQTTLTEITACEETKEVNEEILAKDNGYFAFDVYIKNTSSDEEDDVLQLNLNSAVQVLTSSIQKVFTDESGNIVTKTYTGDAASGLQNTVRVGLALYEGTVGSTATQKEILEGTRGKNIADIAIWEPNASDHVEYIVDNNNKLVNGTDLDTDLSFTTSEQVTTYALKQAALAGEKKIENVYDITSSGLGIQNTLKTEKTNEYDYRIDTTATGGKPIDIKNINNGNFALKANTVSRLRIYVWLEGQDVDCINHASTGGGIEIDLGLTKDNYIGEVLEETDGIEYDVAYAIEGNEVTVTVRAEDELQLPPNGWSYEEVEQAAKSQVYQVASTEPVVLAATTINKKAIQKTYTGEAVERTEISTIYGDKTILQYKIVNITATPSVYIAKYDKVTPTTEPVTATITSEKKITTLPEGWEYTNTNQTEIKKVYTENGIESVSITDETGNATSVSVTVSNIKTVATSTPTLVEQVKSVADKKDVYGQYVNYPIDLNDDGNLTNDWKIFYNDDNHVYLIAADYVKNTKVTNTNLTASGMDQTNGTYSIYWSTPSSTYSLSTSSKYMLTQIGAVSSGNDNYKCAGSLLDPSNWTNVKDSNYALEAVGGPTVEMWVASWNAKGYTKLKTESNSTGYFIGREGNNLADIAGNYDGTTGGYYVSLESEAGYGDELYFPHQDRVGYGNSDGYCFGYWLASPSAIGADFVLYVYYDGDVNSGGYDAYSYAVRPVVSLKSDIKGTLTGDTWMLSTN